MGSAIQYFRKPDAIKSVIVVAGRSEAVRLAVIGELRRRLKVPIHDVEIYDSRDTGVEEIETRVLMAPVFGPREIVHYKVAEGVDTNRLMCYAEGVRLGLWLIVEAEEVKRPDGTRWIDKHKRVQHIDCNPMSETAALEYCQLAGMSQRDAEWLVARYAGDLDEINKCLALLRVMPQPWSPELIKAIAGPRPQQAGYFDKYVVIDNGNELGLCTQLKRRHEQLITLTGLRGLKLNYMERAQRAGVEPFLMQRLQPLVEGATQAKWLSRMTEVVKAEKAVRNGSDGVREYLMAVLR